MSQERKEAIVKLKLAQNLLKTSAFMESSDADNCLEYVDQALFLLKQQPTAGDFTEKVRLSVQSRKSVIAKITDIKILALLGWILQLCDRLDSAEARLKDLLKVSEDILLALDKIKKTQKIDPFYLDTLIAVLKKQSECRPPFEGRTYNPDTLLDNEYPIQNKEG